MRSAILIAALALAGCATPQECVRDYSQPMQIFVPVYGMTVQRTVYPCR